MKTNTRMTEVSISKVQALRTTRRLNWFSAFCLAVCMACGLYTVYASAWDLGLTFGAGTLPDPFYAKVALYGMGAGIIGSILVMMIGGTETAWRTASAVFVIVALGAYIFSCVRLNQYHTSMGTSQSLLPFYGVHAFVGFCGAYVCAGFAFILHIGTSGSLRKQIERCYD